MFRVSISENASADSVRSVRLDRAELAYGEAGLEPGAQPVITTAAQAWSYAASLPLGVDPAAGADLAVEVRLRVLEGTVGVGVLAADEQSFVVEKMASANHGLGTCLVLRLPCPPVVGPLIVRNGSESGPSKAVLEQVMICRLPPSLPPGPAAGNRASEPSQADVPRLVQSLEYLRPLVPYPGWHFDSDWNNPDFSFQTRRRLWEYCLAKRWDVVVDLPWYGGLRVELPLLSDAGRQLFVSGCIDPNEFAFLDAILTPEMVFVDVGAHLGLYSLFAARRTSAVWAFEPSSREIARLQRNLQRNNLTWVQAEQLALGDAEKTTELLIADAMHSGQNTLHSFSHAGVVSDSVETVEMRRLDHLVEQRGLERLDVLKVDAERSEMEVFEGASRVLRSLQPLLLLEVSPASSASNENRALELREFLYGFGYVFYEFDRRTGLLVGAAENHPAGNLVAVPSRKPLPEDALTARRYYFLSGGEKSRSPEGSGFDAVKPIS
jgi:FkbM family methyltransferase